ncbi:MAG: YidB family protein [Pseudomonadota bacterium]
MSILNVAAQLFAQKVGGGENMDLGPIASALQNLLPMAGGDIDIPGLVEKFASGDMLSMVESWLGDGENKSMDASGIVEALGTDKLSSFASDVGISEEAASEGLAGMLPDLVSQNSQGGSILDSVGGVGNALDMAKKFF